MSFSGYNLNGGVHPCLPFYERMLQCAKSEVLPVKMCTAQSEDYLECIHRKKQKSIFPQEKAHKQSTVIVISEEMDPHITSSSNQSNYSQQAHQFNPILSSTVPINGRNLTGQQQQDPQQPIKYHHSYSNSQQNTPIQTTAVSSNSSGFPNSNSTSSTINPGGPYPKTPSQSNSIYNNTNQSQMKASIQNYTQNPLGSNTLATQHLYNQTINQAPTNIINSASFPAKTVAQQQISNSSNTMQLPSLQHPSPQSNSSQPFQSNPNSSSIHSANQAYSHRQASQPPSRSSLIPSNYYPQNTQSSKPQSNPHTNPSFTPNQQIQNQAYLQQTNSSTSSAQPFTQSSQVYSKQVQFPSQTPQSSYPPQTQQSSYPQQTPQQSFPPQQVQQSVASPINQHHQKGQTQSINSSQLHIQPNQHYPSSSQLQYSPISGQNQASQQVNNNPQSSNQPASNQVFNQNQQMQQMQSNPSSLSPHIQSQPIQVQQTMRNSSFQGTNQPPSTQLKTLPQPSGGLCSQPQSSLLQPLNQGQSQNQHPQQQNVHLQSSITQPINPQLNSQPINQAQNLQTLSQSQSLQSGNQVQNPLASNQIFYHQNPNSQSQNQIQHHQASNQPSQVLNNSSQVQNQTIQSQALPLQASGQNQQVQGPNQSQNNVIHNQNHQSHHVIHQSLQDKYDSQMKSTSLLNDEDKWFKLDHEETYLLKQDSLKKSFNKIVQKLQQERHFSDKRKCPFNELETTLDKKQKLDTLSLKEDFGNLRNSFSVLSSLDQQDEKKTKKQKDTVNKMTSEIKNTNTKQVKDVDILRLHYIDLLKTKQVLSANQSTAPQVAGTLPQNRPLQNKELSNQQKIPSSLQSQPNSAPQQQVLQQSQIPPQINLSSNSSTSLNLNYQNNVQQSESSPKNIRQPIQIAPLALNLSSTQNQLTTNLNQTSKTNSNPSVQNPLLLQSQQPQNTLRTPQHIGQQPPNPNRYSGQHVSAQKQSNNFPIYNMQQSASNPLSQQALPVGQTSNIPQRQVFNPPISQQQQESKTITQHVEGMNVQSQNHQPITSQRNQNQQPPSNY